ncbi:head fiber protein [Salmonella phage FSL SP-058]|uniref:Head fiber protein n=1 Tax=Salmonella phage FSL SP-058 TaxID=1173761 RepID=S4TNJ2_9CAUD|nr:head fiber protein [Salmonella phage FSL SP-058]AGF88189.1 hypothetical protein SP058_00370 [Salmonella phage FSL SP-058]UUV42118.1 putative head protein [Salmonella phage S5]
MAYSDVDAILADGKQAVAVKHGGGLVVVGELGAQVLAAKDVTELPDGVGGTAPGAATTTTAGVVKQSTTQAASVATDVAGVVTDLNALITKLKAAGIMA